MKKKIFIISAIMVVLLGACGPAPVPTMNPADVQGTAVAAAWTMVAMTQAAIPTSTPLPPTDTPSPTPLPTFTPLPPPTSGFPTQAFSQPQTGGGAATADPCNGPLSAKAAGHEAPVDLWNKSSGTANISLNLQKTEFGECGYVSFSIGQGHNMVKLLQGCYWAGAFITGPKHTSKAFGTFCIGNPRQKWIVVIKDETIGFSQ